MEPVGEPKPNSTRNKLEIGQIAALAGALSIVAVFVAADSAYSFGRGVSASVGFPAQIMTLRTSTEIFAGIASQNTAAFLALFLIGFLIFPERHGRAANWGRAVVAILGSLLIALIILGTLWDEHGNFYASIATTLSVFAPVLVGYATSVFDGRTKKLIIAGGLTLLIFVFNESELYRFGYSKGKELSRRTTPQFTFAEHGLANVKMRDFPVINLRTQEAIHICLSAIREGESYLYVSNERCFLRLITYDDANYYIVENDSGKMQPMAIRKEVVHELLFANGS